MENKTIYVVAALVKTVPIMVQDNAGTNIQKDLKLDWADGMIGTMPVFDDREAAEKYACDKFEILKFKFEEIGENNEKK